jgi:type IV secretion system protein VirB10
MTTDHIEAMPGDGVAESIRSAGGASVPGERDIPSVNQQRSLQNRVNNLLALIVVTLVGGGFLYFYYSNLSHKQADAKAKVAQERTAKSTGEMKLPPLGAVEGPQAAATDSTAPPDRGPTALADVLGSAPPLGTAGATPSVPGATAAALANGPPVKTASQLAMERQLTPSVFLRSSETANGAGNGLIPVSVSDSPGAAGSEHGQLASYMTPSVATATRAQVLATRRFIIPKGNFLDCTLETAINSELPGMTTCVTAFDIFGADGKVVLLERGSKLVGETRGQVAQGMSRLFVLWSEARARRRHRQRQQSFLDALRRGVAGHGDRRRSDGRRAASANVRLHGHIEPTGWSTSHRRHSAQYDQHSADHYRQSRLSHPGDRREGHRFSARV